MLCSAVENYIMAAKGLPFFYVVGDDSYSSALAELTQHGLRLIRISDFCSKDDKFPNVDELVDYFRTADVDYRENKFVLVGLGEYLALRGTDEAEKELNRLKNTTLGNARVVLLLRGITSTVKAVIANDARLAAQGRTYLSTSSMSSLSATNIMQGISFVKQNGVKWLIRAFEDGACGNFEFSSALSFEKAVVPISRVQETHDALVYTIKGFSLPKNFGIEEQWSQLLTIIKRTNYSLDELFEKHGFDGDFETDIYEKICGLEFRNWLFFMSMKLNSDRIENGYLAYVIKNTESFSELKDNILTLITNFTHTDLNFMRLYLERKKLVRGFPESDIAIFIKENAIDPQEEIYRFTDNTLLERKYVISWIAKNGWNDSFSYVYPALALYLKKYIFECGSMSDELTKYFEIYKTQKVTNKLDDNFLKLVDNFACSLSYSRLQTRDNAIKNIEGKESAFLYWIDSLGVEYLSYFTELARKKGLSMHVDIGRADLPTITSFNKAFYDHWNGIGQYKEEDLDGFKHKEKGGFFFTECEEPIHIASELSVIETAMEQAATQLAMHKCKTFVIASDHGASRLAVLRKKEEKYPSDTKGEHSGRCCKVFDDCDLLYKVEENGYYVLTDYGRFKGSRAANVEVHGGASLEEVVVPVITLRLKKQSCMEIRVLNHDNLQADRKQGTAVSLYISDVENSENVSVVMDATRYRATSKDATHYYVVLNDVKRSKSCMADVYDGGDLVGNIFLNIKGRSGNVNKGFDAEFDDLDL